MHHDQDPVFTEYGTTDQLLLEDRARVSYSPNGVRDTVLGLGNPEMESFISRFKKGHRPLLIGAQTPADLQRVVGERMRRHNGERQHSTIGYPVPTA